MEDKSYFTVDELAKELRVDRHKVVGLIKEHKLSALIVGKQWRISKQSFEDYCSKNTIRATP